MIDYLLVSVFRTFKCHFNWFHVTIIPTTKGLKKFFLSKVYSVFSDQMQCWIMLNNGTTDLENGKLIKWFCVPTIPSIVIIYFGLNSCFIDLE